MQILMTDIYTAAPVTPSPVFFHCDVILKEENHNSSSSGRPASVMNKSRPQTTSTYGKTGKTSLQETGSGCSRSEDFHWGSAVSGGQWSWNSHVIRWCIKWWESCWKYTMEEQQMTLFVFLKCWSVLKRSEPQTDLLQHCNSCSIYIKPKPKKQV